MAERSSRAYRYSLYFCGAITLLHTVSLPVLVTYDGHLYVDLADVLGSNRFPADWDFLRTPLYPLGLKLAFWLLGKQPLSVIALGGLLGFLGIWSLGAAVKEMGYPRAAAAGVVSATLYPTLVAYEHCLLSETGTFFFIALIVRAIVWMPERRSWQLKTSVLTALLAGGFYFRPTFLYLAPVVGGLLLFSTLCDQARLKGSWHALERSLIARAGLQLGVVVAVPFLLAAPWNRAMSQTNRAGEVLLFGLIKQAAIPPGDPALGGAATPYERAIQGSTVNGRLDVGGVRSGVALEVWAAMPPAQLQAAGALFRRMVLQHPVRYLKGVVRTVLLFAGVPALESENALFKDAVLHAPGSNIFPGPARLEEAIGKQFSQTRRAPVIGRLLQFIDPLYEVLIFFGFALAASAALVGIVRTDLPLLAFSLVPGAFLAMHALLLLSLDRYAFPVYPVLLFGLAFLPLRMFHRRPQQEATVVGPTLEGTAERRTLAALATILAVMASWHVIYLSLSAMLPSWDEAHYLSGALQVAKGLRSGTFAEAWQAYVTVLRFKPPLPTLPAAALTLLFGDGILPSMLSLVVIFVGIGLAARSLFRNLLPPLHAGAATVLLCTAPMITGLTHRFYVENLFLFLSIIYLDLLVRHGWSSTKWSALAGVVLGLGVLTKLTFLALLFLPSCYLLFETIRALPRAALPRSLLVLGARVGLMLITGVAIVWPWYSRNWRHVMEHSRAAFECEPCKYPTLSSFFSNISSGPHLFVFCLALVGLVPLIWTLASGAVARESRRAWIALLILALATLVTSTIAVNKATRFSVTWLPALAALASHALFTRLRPGRPALAGVAAACGLSLVLSIHDSFGLVPLPTLRLGDLKIVDNRYPLNIPDWFEDNHPLDRTDYRQRQAGDLIAADAASRLGVTSRPTVRLTVDGLLLNHDMMGLLSTLRGDGAVYRGWLGTKTSGPDAPDYVLHAKNFGRLYSGRQLVEYYPNFDEDVASGKLSYEEVAHLAEPAGAELLIFRRKPLPANRDAAGR